MADPVVMVVDEDGRMHSECLHWEGFPSILWDVTSATGYPIPPRYVGRVAEPTWIIPVQVRKSTLEGSNVI
jgi:hypothetical protein